MTPTSPPHLHFLEKALQKKRKEERKQWDRNEKRQMRGGMNIS
jgi:hypothetical protein